MGQFILAELKPCPLINSDGVAVCVDNPNMAGECVTAAGVACDGKGHQACLADYAVSLIPLTHIGELIVKVKEEYNAKFVDLRMDDDYIRGVEALDELWERINVG